MATFHGENSVFFDTSHRDAFMSDAKLPAVPLVGLLGRSRRLALEIRDGTDALLKSSAFRALRYRSAIMWQASSPFFRPNDSQHLQLINWPGLEGLRTTGEDSSTGD
jgi:hypothetical protein